VFGTRYRSRLGARSLNLELQQALNPPGEVRIERFGWTFDPGDKVMQVENNYEREVFNGDLGVVSRVASEGTIRPFKRTALREPKLLTRTPRPASRKSLHWTMAGYRADNGYRPLRPS
jgi:ATP-dependent RecD-like DNA helicase SH3 domain